MRRILRRTLPDDTWRVKDSARCRGHSRGLRGRVEAARIAISLSDGGRNLPGLNQRGMVRIEKGKLLKSGPARK